MIAAGYIANANGGSDFDFADFAVAKWDPNGNLVWVRFINGTANTADFARAVVVDRRNNVIAAGMTTNVDTGDDFTVAKWDPSGNLLWLRSVTSDVGFLFPRPDDAFAVAVDSHDNAIASGYLAQLGGDRTLHGGEVGCKRKSAVDSHERGYGFP